MAGCAESREIIFRQWLQIASGLLVFALGVHLTIYANIGLAPWDCLGMGISYHTPLNYGVSMTVMALMILGIDLLLKEKIGYGTIIDALLTGNFVQMFNDLNPLAENHSLWMGIFVMMVGFVFMALGMYIYMKAGQCCGPRDALLVGIGKRLPQVPIGYVQIGMWAIVLLLGWFLGGPVEEIKGKYATAISYAKVIDENARAQIARMCDYDFTKGSRIRIMPDVHAGKGSTIGTTMTVTDKAVPNIVGVDIGCGMYTVKLEAGTLDFPRWDEAAHFVPSGMNVWQEKQEAFDLHRLHCYGQLKNYAWIENSVGTLGGGNHFIEIDQAKEGAFYLVIHTGSRNLGKQVAEITASVNRETLDEAPMAYKSLSDILDVIGDTVEVIDVMKPVYNFKAAEK